MTDYAAGSGPAGSLPIASPSAAQIPLVPTATKFDGRSKDYTLDASQNWAAIHPVDQMVALSLLVRRGHIKSAPTVGNTLAEITYLGAPNLVADVKDRVRNSVPLASLLADGSVKEDRIDVDTSNRQLKCAFYYRNMKQDPTRLLRADAAL